MSRLPAFNPDQLNKSQEKIYNDIISGPRGKFGGPFYALIQAPDIANETQVLGAALRFNTKLNATYREIAILTAARHWRNEVEWNAHVVIGQNTGLTEACISGILTENMPTTVCNNQQLVYKFCLELLDSKKVSNETYTHTEALIGIEQVVELVSILGYFSSLAMLLNTFEIAADPKDGIPPQSLFLNSL